MKLRRAYTHLSHYTNVLQTELGFAKYSQYAEHTKNHTYKITQYTTHRGMTIKTNDMLNCILTSFNKHQSKLNLVNATNPHLCKII